jgi:hypothetical protein
MTLAAALVQIGIPLFTAYVLPGLVHLVFSPDPKSWWGGIVDRGRKLGFDPAAFEPDAIRLAKAQAEALARKP